ncbi:hypothetical protein TRFO_38583 [Tritrichomonas foetus]|uniref:Uncharacterized protein n=1 Tax=Tritrichomonas foetus TaxID=1144522 RepID=A0A1J4JCE1_9EUKA|nr:hypothetical protein TRFO_38583 [Tritrichomonas foetus]|eukprot:OHS95315.1 hypothetical protein TRFO_38583 [Tritrichomonas foetus]
MNEMESIFRELDELSELQDHLVDMEESDFDDILNEIKSSKWVSSEDYIRKLILGIYSNFQVRPKKQVLFSELLVALGEYLKKVPKEVIVQNCRNNVARAHLLDAGIIDIDALKLDAIGNNFAFRFFSRELKEKFPDFYEKRIKMSNNLQETMGLIDKNDHNKLRLIGQNHHKIAMIIRDDDVEVFQDFISLNNLKFDSKVPYSIYCTLYYTDYPDDMPTLIEYAALYGSINIFKFLIMQLEMVHSTLPTSLLIYAIAGGNLEIIHLVESKNVKYDQIALEGAIGKRFEPVIEYLLDSNPELSLYSSSSFISIINRLNFSLLKRYLEYVVQNDPELINYMNPSSLTSPLIHAVNEGRIDVVRFLLHVPNIDVNSQNHFRASALHMAAIHGFYDITALLLKQKDININISDSAFYTPLLYAAHYDHLPIFKLLISFQSIELDSVFHVSAFDVACKNNSIDIVKYMIENEMVYTSQIVNGKRFAVLSRSQTVVDYLKDYNIEPEEILPITSDEEEEEDFYEP